MPIALPALQPNRKRNSEIDDYKVSSSDSVKFKKIKKMSKAVEGNFFPPSRKSKEENPITSASGKVVHSISNTSDKRIRDKVPKSKKEYFVTSASGIVVQIKQ